VEITILTKKFSSAKSLKAWLDEPETQQMYDITAINWTERKVRCEIREAVIKMDLNQEN
jgi:hypothetical protein